jgi:hypothetical protein
MWIVLRGAAIAIVLALAIAGCGSTTIINRTVSAAPTTTAAAAHWPAWASRMILSGCERTQAGTVSTCECVLTHLEAKANTAEVLRLGANHELGTIVKPVVQECLTAEGSG